MLKEIVKKLNSDDVAQTNIKFMVYIIIFIFIAVVVCWFVLTQPVSCDNPTEITGVLMGFQENQSYVDVRINNETYLFSRFDKDYMQAMIGHDIVVLCCQQDRDYEPFLYYDMISCYICQESDV